MPLVGLHFFLLTRRNGIKNSLTTPIRIATKIIRPIMVTQKRPRVKNNARICGKNKIIRKTNNARSNIASIKFLDIFRCQI